MQASYTMLADLASAGFDLGRMAAQPPAIVLMLDTIATARQVAFTRMVASRVRG
jgi:hypothetical protein